MAWWRRNGSRKHAANGSNGTNGAAAATRISGDDVLEFVADAPHPRAAAQGGAVATVAAPPAPPAAPSPAPSPAPAAAPAPMAPAARSELVPTGAVRRHTGEHLSRSRATAVHTLSLVDVDLDRVERVRSETGLDLGAFVARALADALTRYPHLNASVEDDGLRVHRDVHLGITVVLDGVGTVAPVVRSADGKRLRALAGELGALQDQARAGTLGPDDLAGATFTIGEPETEPGLVSIPIIHQPQVAILAVGGVQRRPVAVPLPDGGEAIAVHSVAPLALVWDHRAVDRAYASAFLASVRDTLETRDWQAEL